MKFKICENGHTTNVHPWTDWMEIVRRVVREGCMRCIMEKKGAK